MKTISDLVNEQPLFASLTPSQRSFIAGCGRNRTYKDGDLMMTEGERATEFFAIRKGNVSVSIHAPGRGEVVIETRDIGDVVGWSWLFPPYVTQFDVRAIGVTHVIAFDGACLLDKCEADPVLGYALMKLFAQIMSDRIQATRMQLLDIYGHDR